MRMPIHKKLLKKSWVSSDARYEGWCLIYNTERLAKNWTSPIYAFYHPIPNISYMDGHHCHLFACAGKSCKYLCRWFLDKSDSNSTGNLRKHLKSCWGEEALK